MRLSSRTFNLTIPLLILWAACVPFSLRAAGQVYTQSAALVLLEAEAYLAHTPRGLHQWSSNQVLGGFSGGGYLEALPDAGSNIQTDVTTGSPELSYTVHFNRSGTHHVWLSGYAADGGSDSVHVGLDGVPLTTIDLNAVTNAWVWTNRAQGGGTAALNVAATGTHSVHLWMREDGFRVDRFALTTNAAFRPRAGNAWHIPHNLEPGIPSMRQPYGAIFSNTAVTIYNGSQFQGAGNAANQLESQSALFYRSATGAQWTTAPMTFHLESGINKYFSSVIPAHTFAAGEVVQYYLRIAYSDRLPTFLFISNGVPQVTLLEQAAQANPFSYRVLATPDPGYPSPADWRDMNIYQIFIDRFSDGDPANNDINPQQDYNPGNSRGIHGGDFRGIQQKLDYLQALGATAIWITPIFLNVGASSYHGYGTHDFFQLAPHLGTMSDLTSMVAAAHARDIRVVLDIVCNHQGRRITSSDSGWSAYKAPPNTYNLQWISGVPYPPPFDSLSYFHAHGRIQNFSDPEQILGALSGLDDLKTETLHVRTNMVNIYQHWVQDADLDGFRIDTVKHVEMGFWQHFNPEIRAHAAALGKTNFFTFGEVFDGSDAKCGSYTGTKSGPAFANDSVLDYPLYYVVNSALAGSGNTKQIEDRYQAISTHYDPAAHYRLVTFIDNHDQLRFMNSNRANNNMNRLLLTLAWLYSARGIPCLYYGTEQAFNGGADPNNREDMFDGQFEQGPSLGDNFNMTHPAFLEVAMLNNFRRRYPSLRRGTHHNLWNNPSGPGLFAYSRRLDGEEVYVVLNTAGSSQTIGNRPTSHDAGVQLVNLFNTNEIITTVSGTDRLPPVTVPSLSYKAFVARSLWKPLDPVVTNQVPTHGLTNFSPHSDLVLEFSKPMDTATVQAAFSVTPAVGGAFHWTNGNRRMKFVAAGAGFAALATNVVRIETSAQDVASSNTLFAPFETFFVTTASSVTDVVPPTVSITLPTQQAILAGTFAVTGTAGDDTAVQAVEVRLDNNGWQPATGTVAWSYAFNARHFPNGPHQVSARASDTSGNLSEEAARGVWFFNVPGPFELRVSAGSAHDVTNCDAQVWQADRPYNYGDFGFVGGTTGFIANLITGVCVGAQPLYQSERYSLPDSSFRYLFHCPPGWYETLLVQAETWVTGVNQRVFDVFIEGDRVLQNFDLLETAGGMNLPLVQAFTNAVVDGLMEIQFLPVVENARISGLQIRRIGDLDSDGDGIPDWWMLGHFGHATGQEGDQTLAHEDRDDDAMNNWEEFAAGTLPTNGTSFLRITLLEQADGLQITFPSAADRLYHLDARSSLDDEDDWAPLPDPAPGTGGDLFLMDTNAFDYRLYRIRVQPLPAP